MAIRDGRVSSEVLRQRTVSAAGEHHVIATEYAVLDRAGRLQLPRAHVEALGLEKRVRLELEEDHIGVWPDRTNGGPSRAAIREDVRQEPARVESAADDGNGAADTPAVESDDHARYRPPGSRS